MLLWLTDYLSAYVGGFVVFQYLTLRTMVSVMTALATSLLIGPWMIARLSKAQIGQVVRDDGPASHFSKAGTPTMGGALILIIIIIIVIVILIIIISLPLSHYHYHYPYRYRYPYP